MGYVDIKSNQRVVRVTDRDIIANVRLYKSHRQYVEKRFRDIGFEVITHQSLYDMGKKIVQGLEYYRGDSVVTETIDIVGTIGVNIRPIEAIEVDNATGNQV